MQDIMKKFYQIKRNFIISILILIQHNFIISQRPTSEASKWRSQYYKREPDWKEAGE